MMFIIITKINLVYFDIIFEYLHCAFFISLHTNWRHSNKAVQEAIPLIVTHIQYINKNTLIIKLK